MSQSFEDESEILCSGAFVFFDGSKNVVISYDRNACITLVGDPVSLLGILFHAPMLRVQQRLRD